MLLPSTPTVPTPPASNVEQKDIDGMQHAILQAEEGAKEGGVPIGAALIDATGKVISVGRNRRVQLGSMTRHGETDCLENAGRIKPDVFKGATMYSTLSPCPMCTGAIILFGIRRVVMGENETFLGGEDILRSRNVEVINMDMTECKNLMKKFIETNPEDWNEDIGEDDEA